MLSSMTGPEPIVQPLRYGTLRTTLRTAGPAVLAALAARWPDVEFREAGTVSAGYLLAGGARAGAFDERALIAAAPAVWANPLAIAQFVDFVDGPLEESVTAAANSVLKLRWDEPDVGELRAGELYPAVDVHRLFSPAAFTYAALVADVRGRELLAAFGAPLAASPAPSGEPMTDIAAARAWLEQQDLRWLAGSPTVLLCDVLTRLIGDRFDASVDSYVLPDDVTRGIDAGLLHAAVGIIA